MGLSFGDEDSVHVLQPVTLKGPDGEPLVLAYRTTTTWILLGTKIKDQGYVLARENDTHHFFPLPDNVAQLQKQKALPDPLPPYHLRISEYLAGYSFWIVLVFLIAWVVGNLTIERSRKARIAASKRAAAE